MYEINWPFFYSLWYIWYTIPYLVFNAYNTIENEIQNSMWIDKQNGHWEEKFNVNTKRLDESKRIETSGNNRKLNGSESELSGNKWKQAYTKWKRLETMKLNGNGRKTNWTKLKCGNKFNWVETGEEKLYPLKTDGNKWN